MSLDKGLNINLEETAADRSQIQSAVPRNQSVKKVVKEGVRDSGIWHQKDWHKNVIFFVKEKAQSMEDWLRSMLPLKT